jgi:hypothetical protein
MEEWMRIEEGMDESCEIKGVKYLELRLKYSSKNYFLNVNNKERV